VAPPLSRSRRGANNHAGPEFGEDSFKGEPRSKRDADAPERGVPSLGGLDRTQGKNLQVLKEIFLQRSAARSTART
jgi:hypothetical protein